ncbi:hypothetical protein ACTS9D_12950 [Empedobacter brevis]
MVRILNNITLFIICVAFITCKSLDRNNNYHNESIELNIYSKIDTNTIYKKVSVDYYNATGQLNCEFIKFKPDYKVAVYPCNRLQISKKKINKNNGVFYLINPDRIGVNYTVNTWHGKQKHNDTFLILKDSLIKFQNFTEQKAIIKEVYIKILDLEK